VVVVLRIVCNVGGVFVHCVRLVIISLSNNDDPTSTLHVEFRIEALWLWYSVVEIDTDFASGSSTEGSAVQGLISVAKAIAKNVCLQQVVQILNELRS